MDRTVKKVLFWTHLIAGVSAGLVILTMAVTGAMLSFEKQIVEKAEQNVRIVTPPSAEAQRLSLDEIVASAQKEKPKALAMSVTLKNDRNASTMVGFGRAGALYVDPYTGKVLGGESKTHDVMHVIEDIHRYLGKREIGKPITGVAVVLFFVLLLSGIYIWWPKRTYRFNKRLKGKARDWNWHNVFGIWFSPLILITTVTGMLIAHTWATNFLYRITGNKPPPAQQQQRGNKPPEKALPMAKLDVLAAKAATYVCTWESINLRFPQKEGAPVTAIILEEAPEIGIPIRSTLSMDALTGEMKKWEPFMHENSGRKARVWARYLHTGEALGLPGRIAFFCSALAIVLMVWTGIALAYRRFFI